MAIPHTVKDRTRDANSAHFGSGRHERGIMKKALFITLVTVGVFGSSVQQLAMAQTCISKCEDVERQCDTQCNAADLRRKDTPENKSEYIRCLHQCGETAQGCGHSCPEAPARSSRH